jgi:hypothetical protein
MEQLRKLLSRFSKWFWFGVIPVYGDLVWLAMSYVLINVTHAYSC